MRTVQETKETSKPEVNINNNIDLNGLGKKIVDFISIYFREYENITKKGLNLEEDNAFVFHLFDKISENFSVVGKLLELSEQKNMSYLKNSIYILLRSGLSDVIVICWLLEVDETKSLNKKIIELRKDHLKFYISYLQTMDKLKLLSNQEKIDELSVINKSFNHLLPTKINGDFSTKGIERSTSIKSMLNESNKHNVALVEAYKTYHIFSKVEHIGEFTRMLIEESYKKDNATDQYIHSAVNVIVTTIKAFSTVFFEDEEFKERIKNFECK